ncbi:hypothetical protein [Paenibacillus agricola]|uniref:Fe/B12 periplasmic-binding domain-containing protein n=1 Tax=Paenibacillus agricola TaxID=2716264 RepID=A0ABX0JIC0_9BACL|nr:hypothetical protein [Paenibacillus agricola]NHN34453.1 hypothetical protein [Paenibacillus agricola]
MCEVLKRPTGLSQQAPFALKDKALVTLPESRILYSDANSPIKLAGIEAAARDL